MSFLNLTDTGLEVASRQEIYESLKLAAINAYGDDVSFDAGTSFDSFLRMLADDLAVVGGSVQSFSEILSTKTASGAFLDFVAGRSGIVRKRKRNQRVIMTVDLGESIQRPFMINKGLIRLVESGTSRVWTNTTQLIVHAKKFVPSGDGVEENYQGTCEFGLLPLDGADSTPLPLNSTFVIQTPLDMGDTVFTNHVNASPPVHTTETDAQFRARYDSAVYSNAISSVEGLRSRLLRVSDEYVRIVENLTNGTVDGIAPHSIWCIVGGLSSHDNSDSSFSTDVNDVEVAQTILYYKSLGCGVSVKPSIDSQTVPIDGTNYYAGNFKVEIPMGTMIAEIPFTRMVRNKVTFAVTLSTTSSDGGLKASVAEKVSLSLQAYVSSLQPSEVVTTSAIVSAIQSVLSKYEVGLFDYVSHTTAYDINGGIQIYQKAVGGVATVSWGGGS